MQNRFAAHCEFMVLIIVVSSVCTALTPMAGCNAVHAAGLRVVLGAAQGPIFPCIAGLFGQWVKPTEYSRVRPFQQLHPPSGGAAAGRSCFNRSIVST